MNSQLYGSLVVFKIGCRANSLVIEAILEVNALAMIFGRCVVQFPFKGVDIFS